jgi:hypothetical protein
MDGGKWFRLLIKNFSPRFDWDQAGWKIDRSSLTSVETQPKSSFTASVHRWYLAKNAFAA